MTEKNYLTQEQLEEKKNQLTTIVNISLPDNAIELEEAKAQGDLSENAEYDAAKERNALLNKQKNDLEHLINNAIIITENKNSEKVEIGHYVTIQHQDKTKEKIQLIGYGNGEDKISINSPLGQSVFNRTKGDSVTVDAPEKRYKVKILKISSK